eukprot:12817938-Alexandrium_andersonii.AAC.1
MGDAPAGDGEAHVVARAGERADCQEKPLRGSALKRDAAAAAPLRGELGVGLANWERARRPPSETLSSGSPRSAAPRA